MEKLENIKFFLVLEKRLGDYNIIDINKLDICKNYVNNDLSSIDFFTSVYSENELKASIERSNIVQSSYLDGTIKVISEARHNFKVLTRDVLERVLMFKNSNEPISPDLKSKLFGAYKKVVDSSFQDPSFTKGLLDRFKLTIKEEDKQEIFSIIEELPYYKVRSIYFRIFKELENKKLNNLRRLEKLNEHE